MKAQPTQTEPKQAAVPAWERNAVVWTPGETTFPMSNYERKSRWFALFVSCLGFAATYLPLHALYSDWKEHGWFWSFLLLRLPYLAAGIGMSLFGVSRFYARRLFTLRKEEVECDEIGIFGREHWKESTRKYEGTLKQIKFYSGGRAGRARFYYEVILKHPNPAKSVVLFRSYSWRPLEEAWRRFAKIFSVHALEQTAKGIAKLSPRDLEARQSMGDLSSWIDPSGFSSSLSFKTVGDVYELRFRDRLPAFGKLFSAALWGALTYAVIGYFGPEWGSIPAVGLFVSVMGFVNRLLGWEVVRLAAAGAEYLRETPFGIRPVSQLPAELLTNCLLRKTGRFARSSVVLEAGGECLAFGASLSPGDKERVRDLAILVLSQGPARFDLAG